MWTRSQCRTCQTNIPSVLLGKHRQAVSNKGGQSESASSSSGESVLLGTQGPVGYAERDKVEWYEGGRRKPLGAGRADWFGRQV